MNTYTQMQLRCPACGHAMDATFRSADHNLVRYLKRTCRKCGYVHKLKQQGSATPQERTRP